MALAVYVSPAQALTLHTAVAPVLTENQLLGCSINFVTAQPDEVSMDGGISLAMGSVIFFGSKDKPPLFMLKLGVAAPGAYGQPQPPHGAALRNGSATNVADKQSAEQLSPGYLTTIFRVEDATNEAFFGALAKHRLDGIYTMSEGEAGVPFTVDLQVAETNPTTDAVTSGQATREFLDCMDGLLKPIVSQ